MANKQVIESLKQLTEHDNTNNETKVKKEDESFWCERKYLKREFYPSGEEFHLDIVENLLVVLIKVILMNSGRYPKMPKILTNYRILTYNVTFEYEQTEI